MKTRLLFPILLLVFASNALAVDPSLSLEDATKIAKERIKKDGLPEDHLVVEWVDMPQFKEKFYFVRFDPHIPDPKKDGTFIGYEVKMDGTIERSVITETISRVPAKVAGMSEIRFDAKKAASSALLDNPFTLHLDAGTSDRGADP